MGSTRLPGVDRLIGSLATIGVGVAIYLAHQFLKPKEMTLDEYYRQKYVDPSTLVGHKGSCGCGNLTFIVLAPRSLCAFDDSNTFPSKLGRIPVFLAPMTHLQMTSNHSATDVAVYSHQASATYATQHVFCKQCGIHLFHMELHRNDQVAINVYTLETDYIEDLRVVFVPQGAYPLFQRVPSSAVTDGETFPSLAKGPSKQRQAALQQGNQNASEFEKQLMLWAHLDPGATPDSPPSSDGQAASHDDEEDDGSPNKSVTASNTQPVTLDKIPEQELVRMKYQLQYYLQRHLETNSQSASCTV
ncbi:hypothetical protein H310_12105 [Aphanomyces invadans]|uniref:CENP-V/GFA domain-containing protein n=1 Tax=Aphanomyces invadans TaxID=157072 RepID=A0A024TJA7_9STRA|nr:hypothetical protein H310_12105 [Aphanomyces invadans]ETV94074.1 hypothetical protein H310_12105 [Aphanomyces invadans]|eukprot:XP_008877278.1 hypothetical protein H310_12105 [Aphanomyces invadans]